MSGLMIGLTIDRSSSMKPYIDDVRSGMRQLIGSLKEEQPDARLHASYFNREYQVIHNDSLQSFNVDEKANQYSLARGTALFDAIARLISDVRKTNSDCPELEKPRHVAILVMTDGNDLDSKKETAHSVNRLVQEVRKEGWLCLFLSSHHNGERIAKQCGFDHSCSAYFDPKNSGTALSEASKCISKYQRGEWDGFAKEDRLLLSSGGESDRLNQSQWDQSQESPIMKYVERFGYQNKSTVERQGGKTGHLQESEASQSSEGWSYLNKSTAERPGSETGDPRESEASESSGGWSRLHD